MYKLASNLFAATAIIAAIEYGEATRIAVNAQSPLPYAGIQFLANTSNGKAEPTSEANNQSRHKKGRKERKMDKTTDQDKSEMNPEITAAISEFKAQPNDRQKAAKKLLPLIKPGMTVREVETLLGAPSAKFWSYSLFYSSNLTIRFDPGGKVTDVSSDLLDEVRTGEGSDSSITDPAIVAAMSEFKTQPYNRQKAAKKLLPLIKPPAPIHEVEAMLGAPNTKFWSYSLLLSSASSLTIRFGTDGKVEKVVSTDLAGK